jgi:hypothetical protein
MQLRSIETVRTKIVETDHFVAASELSFKFTSLRGRQITFGEACRSAKNRAIRPSNNFVEQSAANFVSNGTPYPCIRLQILAKHTPFDDVS